MSRIDARSQAGRALSQHSLRDRTVAARIVAHSGLAPPDVVFEAGAGDGMLTAELAHRARRVLAVEHDRQAWTELKSRFGSDPRVTPVLADFMRYSLPATGDYKVVANPPFAITSALIRRLMDAPNPPVEAALVVQREAALRWSGQVEESVVSLVAKIRFEFDIRLALRRQDFRPYPRVGCVLLGMKRRPRPLLSRAEERRFEAFLRTHFGRGDRRTARANQDPGTICFEEWVDRFCSGMARREYREVAAAGRHR